MTDLYENRAIKASNLVNETVGSLAAMDFTRWWRSR